MAEVRSNEDGLKAPAWLNPEMRDVFDGASILLVEDDDDIRELMTTLLELAGFATTACSTAEAALQELREQPFDMVLTDYMLPHRTGGWLLRQASDEGLLDATPALVVSAHPNPPDVDGFEIVPKPFDLDDLVSKVRRRLDTSSARASMAVRPPVAAKKGQDGGGNGGLKPVELILYISSHSPSSASAVATIKTVVGRFSSSRVKLTICDLSKTPSAGTDDAIAFTPTLVKRSPGPRTFILGHISNPELVAELLASCAEDLR